MGTELRPRPLTVDDSELLITAATEHAPLRPHDAQTLARRSGGNPLFLHGLLGAVGDSGSVDGLPHTIEAMVVALEGLVDLLEPEHGVDADLQLACAHRLQRGHEARTALLPGEDRAAVAEQR